MVLLMLQEKICIRDGGSSCTFKPINEGDIFPSFMETNRITMDVDFYTRLSTEGLIIIVETWDRMFTVQRMVTYIYVTTPLNNMRPLIIFSNSNIFKEYVMKENVK